MTPIRNHSHYSLLSSVSRNEQIVDSCIKNGYKSVGLTDISTISGVVNFIQACKDKVRPIIGCELVLHDRSTLTLICKNKNAWNQLLKVISRANDQDNFEEVARIDYNELITLISPDDFICIDGYVGSRFFHVLFPSTECLFNASDVDGIRNCLIEDHAGVAHDYISQIRSVFKDYYLEIDKVECPSFPVNSVLADIIDTADPKVILQYPIPPPIIQIEMILWIIEF
jgi:DNA polymerase III alpha subunit